MSTIRNNTTANNPTILKGNLVADPVLREVQIAGSAYPVKVTKFKILVNPTDENGNRIEGAAPTAYWVPQWRADATNAALTLAKGDFVQVTGYPTEGKPFTGDDGQQHTITEIKGASVALLRKAVAKTATQALSDRGNSALASAAAAMIPDGCTRVQTYIRRLPQKKANT